MTNNLLMSYLSYSRENQRIYRYILENSSDNERALSYLICRDIDNNRSRFQNRNRQNVYRPVRNYSDREENNIRIPEVIPSSFFTPVNISPSLTQINNSCSTMLYDNLADEEKIRHTSCTITLNQFTSNSRVMKINHCGHIFSEEGLRQHFNNSVRCPICRYDIRNDSTQNDNNENNNNENDNNMNNVIDNLISRIRNNYTDNSGNDISLDLSNNTIHVTYTLYQSEI